MELEVTWKIALEIWWAWVWRAILSLIPMIIIVFIFSFIIIFVTRLIGVPQDIAMIIAQIFNLPFGIGIGVFVFKKILNKDFGNFRLSVVSIENASEKK